MSAAVADILARLQAAGLTVSPDRNDPGKVYVAPRDRLTPELRELIHAHKPELLTELQSRRTDTSGVCGSCWHFRPAPGQAPDGRCARYGGEAWAALTGGCDGGWEPRDPVAREQERRRVEVAERLKADPALRYAFDVANASATGPAQREVSVMLGLRDRDGRIITGELRVPAAKWDMAAFLAYWDAQGRPS